jgi:hypothetical protein
VLVDVDIAGAGVSDFVVDDVFDACLYFSIISLGI